MQNLPKPTCICFYHGVDAALEREVLRLSDAFLGPIYDGQPGDFEVCVTVLHVNYGHNAQLLDACVPPYEYSWFVEAIRRHNKVCGNLGDAREWPWRRCQEAFSIKVLLLRNRAEVRGMVFSELNERALLEKHYRMQRLEGRREGMRESKLEIAANMLRLGDPVEKVAACCGLGEDEVRSLAEGAPVH